jgi:cell division septation protein DedD
VELNLERIKQKLEEAGKQRGHLQHGHTTSTEDVSHRERSAFRSENNRLFTGKGNTMWLLSGMAVVIASVTITWWIASDQQPGGTRLSDLDLLESPHASATESLATEKLETRITALIERLEILTGSITDLESRLMRAHAITDSIAGAEQKLASSTTPELPANAEAAQVFDTLPPPAAGHTGREASIATAPRQASAGVTTRPRDTTVIAAVATTEPPPLRKSDKAVPQAPASPTPGTDTVAGDQSSNRKPLRTAVMERQDTVSNKPPVVSADKDGPWIINLVSSPSKANADRLAKKARSRDIQTEQQQVTVNGKQYWRVQVTGFSTKDEAMTYADTVREKLGLKDVWIMTR